MPAASKILIINRALYKFGSERISSLTEESKASEIASEIYDELRDETLEAHDWKFARTEAALNRLSASANPSETFAYAFQLPVDHIRTVATDIPVENDWKEMAEKIIVCDESTLTVVYTRQVTDESAFSFHFREALACRLAMDMVYPMTGKTDLIEVYTEQYRRALAMARSFDSQSGGRNPKLQATTWTKRRL